MQKKSAVYAFESREELSSRQECICNVRSHTHTNTHTLASRLSSVAIQRCSAAQLEVSKLGQGLLRRSVSSTHTTHTQAQRHAYHTCYRRTWIIHGRIGQEATNEVMQTCLKHMDFSLAGKPCSFIYLPLFSSLNNATNNVQYLWLICDLMKKRN